MATDIYANINLDAPASIEAPTPTRLAATLHGLTGWDTWDVKITLPRPDAARWTAMVVNKHAMRWTHHQREIGMLSSVYPGVRITAELSDENGDEWRIYALDGKTESVDQIKTWPESNLWSPEPEPASPFESDAVKTIGRHLQDYRQKLTVIAALRYWQALVARGNRHGAQMQHLIHEWDIASDGGNRVPLTPEEIEAIIVKLQGE